MRFEPNAESLQQHALPDWYGGAKLGLIIHWGPYSVPAWAEGSGGVQELWAKKGPAHYFKHNPYAEWYVNTIQVPGSEAQRHHIETYGPDLVYDDFIPMFNEEAAGLDASAWADLFARARARYVVLTTKHMDGFTLWPSRHRNPNKEYYRSPRDIVGDVTAAVRSRGLKMGLYYSGGYDRTFNSTVIRDPWSALAAIPQGLQYADYAGAHLVELIERYQPSVLWNDIAYPAAADLEELLALYYNTVPDGVINDRWGRVSLPQGRLTRAFLSTVVRGLSSLWPLLPASARRLQMLPAAYSDFTTPEYTVPSDVTEHKWETVRGLGPSFGWNRREREEAMLSGEELVRLLVDVASKNGNLLLGIAPRQDGTVPEPQEQRLLQLGDWLGTNGEAIFDTKPWARTEGTTRDGLPIRFTSSDDAVFAILLGAATGARLTIEGVSTRDGTEVHLLGHGEELAWERQSDGLAVALPGPLPPSHAHAFKISPPPLLDAPA